MHCHIVKDIGRKSLRHADVDSVCSRPVRISLFSPVEERLLTAVQTVFFIKNMQSVSFQRVFYSLVRFGQEAVVVASVKVYEGLQRSYRPDDTVCAYRPRSA